MPRKLTVIFLKGVQMKFVYLLAALPVALTRMALAQCPTIPNPAADSPTVFPGTTAAAFAAIDAAHVAEGVCARCSPGGSMIETYLPDPVTYAALNPDQKVLLLINAERIIRGIPPILGPGGTTTGANDPFMGNITANHSLLVAQNAGWWNLPIAIIHNNAIDGTASGRETTPLGPPGLVSFGAGEIIAVDHSIEGAVFEWMYADSDSNWGHRDNILNCTYNLMGAGVATSLANVTQWGTGAIVVTVDFIATQPGNTYTAPVLPAPAPCPPVPAPAQWTCPTVAAPKVFSELGGLVTLSADGTTINIAANISVDPLDGAPNQVRSFLVFQPANWGSPSGGEATLGVSPQGTGAFSCPLIPVLHTALDPTDPATADPTAVTSRCVATIPFAGNPVVISISDTYNNLVYMTTNLTPPM
jgi:hypothetical protein